MHRSGLSFSRQVVPVYSPGISISMSLRVPFGIIPGKKASRQACVLPDRNADKYGFVEQIYELLFSYTSTVLVTSSRKTKKCLEGDYPGI